MFKSTFAIVLLLATCGCIATMSEWYVPRDYRRVAIPGTKLSIHVPESSRAVFSNGQLSSTVSTHSDGIDTNTKSVSKIRISLWNMSMEHACSHEERLIRAKPKSLYRIMEEDLEFLPDVIVKRGEPNMVTVNGRNQAYRFRYYVYPVEPKKTLIIRVVTDRIGNLSDRHMVHADNVFQDICNSISEMTL